MQVQRSPAPQIAPGVPVDCLVTDRPMRHPPQISDHLLRTPFLAQQRFHRDQLSCAELLVASGALPSRHRPFLGPLCSVPSVVRGRVAPQLPTNRAPMPPQVAPNLRSIQSLRMQLLAEDPKVNAPISPEDVQEICALVRVATSEPILEISEVTTEAYIPGVTPRQVVVISANGERHEATEYSCLDRVWVFTHPAQGSPLWFDIHKKDNKWTILKTERMTNR